MAERDPSQPRAPSLWPIGYFNAELVGDVIHVTSSGEFNWECAMQFRRGLMELIPRLPRAFGILSEFDVAPIMTPEVEKLMARLTAEGMPFGFRASAFVSRRREAVAIAEAQWRRIYEPLGLSIRFFDEIESAKEWLGGAISARE